MKETTVPTPTESIPTSVPTVARRVGLIMTYNQRETCIEAVNSLVTQTLALDLIIISDDFSTDGTYEVIKNYLLQNNQHSNIKVYQSEKNLGFIPHFNTVIKEHCAESDLIYYNAGDDISEANRVEEFYRDYVAKENPRYFLGHSYVTSFGSGTEEILVPPIESIKENRELCLIASAYHIGASQVFTSALFFDFGPILFDDCYEDLTLGYRALLKNAYHFIPQPLLRYRVGGLSSWQKNPLEKKRGRLKSTLTQRAVDSIRSGDLTTLSTIQDCYSQYGFSHVPHANQLEVCVVGEKASDIQIFGYSLADHFPVISNVCRVKTLSPNSFINCKPSTQKIESNTLDGLVWLKVPTVNYEVLQQLMSDVSIVNGARIVFDFGLLSPSALLQLETTAIQVASRLSMRFPKALIHTSCPNFFSNFSALKNNQPVSYIPPLQYIDGPDPVVERPVKKRGIVFVVGSSKTTDLALSQIKQAHGNHIAALGALYVINREVGDRSFFFEGQPLAKERVLSCRGVIDSCNFDYVIALIDPNSESPSLLRHCWAFSAQSGLPIFINSDSSHPSDLTQGKNCLFVDNDLSAWSAAMSLVSTSYDRLQQIASEARHDCYFNYSIQKRVNEVTALLGRANSEQTFFDKFFPL
jgi:hypothetical protein